MDAVEWGESADPDRMLAVVGDLAGDREYRLFACACARDVWDFLTPDGRRAVESAERAAAGLPLPMRLAEFGYRVREQTGRLREEARRGRLQAASAARLCTVDDARFGAGAWQSAARARAWQAVADLPPTRLGRPTWDVTERVAHARQAGYLRDLVRPFGGPIELHRDWLRWDGGTVRALAEAVAEDADFERLGVVADALEEAGCALPELLDHLRHPGPHVRGCWALEAVLRAPA